MYDKVKVLQSLIVFDKDEEKGRRMMIESGFPDEPWFNSAFLHFVLRKSLLRPCTYTAHVLFSKDCFLLKSEFNELLKRARELGMTDADECLVRLFVDADCRVFYRNH